MNVGNLVILLENVACALVHEAWVVEGVEALPLDAVGAPVTMDMDAGLLAVLPYLVLFYYARTVFF